MRTLLRLACQALYLVCPLLAFGSLVWVFLSSAPWYVAIPLGSLGFFGFGFLGMFAGSAAGRLQSR
jgi:hypothetical protein